MELEKIQAEARTLSGKGIARKLRAVGKMPAVAYGAGGDAVPLTLVRSDLMKLRKGRLGWNQPLAIEIEGGDTIPLAMLRDVQRNPLTGGLLHADFIVLTEGIEIVVNVPVKTEGKAVGEELGGMVIVVQRSIEVHCLPKNIPDRLVVDITPLNVGDKIVLSELKMPTGVSIDLSVDSAVVSLVGRPIEEEEVLEDEEGEEGEEGEGGEEGEDGASGDGEGGSKGKSKGSD